MGPQASGDFSEWGIGTYGLAELAPRGFAGMIQVDVGRPSQFHGLSRMFAAPGPCHPKKAVGSPFANNRIPRRAAEVATNHLLSASPPLDSAQQAIIVRGCFLRADCLL
jgi:hypothetical protein